MFKGEKGITLIALAITIIVLLILAGISITALGQGGIMGQASKASEQYSIQASKEDAALSAFSSSLSYFGSLAGYTLDTND